MEPIDFAEIEIGQLEARLLELKAELKTATNLSNARRKWWDKAREREKQLKAENKNLHFEVKVLKKFIANNEIILKSANTDVRRMTKYTDELRAENKRYETALVAIAANEDYAFAECTVAEFIMETAKQALKGEIK